MFSSFILSGAVLAVLNALPTTALVFPTTLGDVNITAASSHPILEARNGREIINIDCDLKSKNSGTWGKWEIVGHYGKIPMGIIYLKTVMGKPKNGRGPQNCGRDPKGEKELESYGEIAWAAQQVYDTCQWKGGIYMKDQWSVIIHEDWTDC
ncbi:hypothetical protein QBC45DRAFT_315606 [Copromyces sp. CBS 386.78]|nr:hypothetical protein QBC45DRAFT_315606 [Copromyces sp. CBS 386.78]